MKIQTLKHEYYILQKVWKTKNIEFFYCKDESQPEGKQYFNILRVKERELTLKLIVIFTEQMKHTAFEDFFECFSKDGELYLVFFHKDAQKLSEKLEKEECVLKERLEIGKKLLEKILLLDMPEFILYEVLREDSLLITSALDICFYYELKEIEFYETVTKKAVDARLAATFQKLFEFELIQESCEEIPDFLERVLDGKYGTFMQLYQEYVKMAERLLEKGKLLRPNTIWFRIWEKIKKFWKKLKPILFTSLIVLFFGFLFYSLMHPKQSAENRFDFKQIGSRTISSDSEETKPEEGQEAK